MKTKFELGEKVLSDSKKATIIAINKNFGSGKLIYTLDSGKKVTEDELTKISKKQLANKKLKAVKNPSAKKIAKKKENKLSWDLLLDLDYEHLCNLIMEKKLNIEEDKFPEVCDLRKEIAKKLDIQVKE